MRSPSRLEAPSLTVLLAAAFVLALLAAPRLWSDRFIVRGSPAFDPLSIPNSHVLSLPSFSTSPILSISFHANTGEASLAYVELYFNRNGQGWTKYGDQFTNSPIAFDSGTTGGDGSYGFYTVVTDSDGVTEAPPAGLVPDATTIVDTQPPTFGLDSTGTTVGTGDQLTLSVVVTDANGISSVTAEYWQGSGLTQTQRLLPEGSFFTATVNIPSNSVETLHYRFRAIDGTGLQSTGEIKNVTVQDYRPPTIQILTPSGGTILRGGTNTNIAWTAQDNIGLIASSATVSVSINGGDSWSQLGNSLAYVGSITWFVPITDVTEVVVAISAVDTSGNVGRQETSPPLAIDSTPPTTTVSSPPVVATNSFIVGWSATDNIAGVSTYYVQYRVGDSGTWQDWFPAGVPATTTWAVFGPTDPVAVNDGSVFYFRASAVDKAGNAEEFTADGPISRTAMVRFKVYLPLTAKSLCVDEPTHLTNGTFEQGFDGWEHGGGLPSSIVNGAGPQGSNALLLGNPDYPCDAIPVNQSAWARQRTTISTCAGGTTLAFSFRMITFDVEWSNVHNQYVDTFELAITDADTGELLHFWRYGNTDGTSYGCEEVYRKDFGWQEHSVDLSAFRGRTIEVEFSNWNRLDGYLNTYTYVDNVRFQ